MFDGLYDTARHSIRLMGKSCQLNDILQLKKDLAGAEAEARVSSMIPVEKREIVFLGFQSLVYEDGRDFDQYPETRGLGKKMMVCIPEMSSGHGTLVTVLKMWSIFEDWGYDYEDPSETRNAITFLGESPVRVIVLQTSEPTSEIDLSDLKEIRMVPARGVFPDYAKAPFSEPLCKKFKCLGGAISGTVPRTLPRRNPQGRFARPDGTTRSRYSRSCEYCGNGFTPDPVHVVRSFCSPCYMAVRTGSRR